MKTTHYNFHVDCNRSNPEKLVQLLYHFSLLNTISPISANPNFVLLNKLNSNLRIKSAITWFVIIYQSSIFTFLLGNFVFNYFFFFTN